MGGRGGRRGGWVGSGRKDTSNNCTKPLFELESILERERGKVIDGPLSGCCWSRKFNT